MPRCSTLLLMAFSLLLQLPTMAEPADSIVDFKTPPLIEWRSINDGVMGGLSAGRLRRTEQGSAVFEGSVSLENNGGFASVRASLGELDLTSFEGLEIRFRGDGRKYRLRLRTDDGYDGIAYQATFETTGEDWEVARLPFLQFLPTYRGRMLRSQAMNPADIRQIGLMIADKQAGTFRLEIDWVRPFREETP